VSVITAAIRKDALLLLRDRGALISLFLLPVIFIVVFGSMFGSGGERRGKPRPIALHVEPGAERGPRVTAVLGAAEAFVAEPAPSADVVRSRVADEHVVAGLIVPRDGPIELAIDLGSPIQVRGPIQGALTAMVTAAVAAIPLPKEPVVVAVTPPGISKPLANIGAFQVTVPGNATLFGFFIALTTAMAFLGERKSGTWRRLLAAPVPRWQALLATLVPYYLVGVIQLAFLFALGVFAFGMQIAGSLVALVVLSLAVVACSVALGLLMAAVARTEKQLGGIGSVVLLVMGMLGGCMVPRLVMPPFMKMLGLGVPHGWALDGYYAILVREGTGIADVTPSIAALLGFAVLFAGVGLALFKFER
jgi:ABC-2 type transport system permease protein